MNKWKNEKIGLGIGTTAAVALLIAEAYQAFGEKELHDCQEFVKQSLQEQAYEVLSNSSDIDRKIRKKTDEIALLKQKLNEIETSEIKKKKRKALCSHIHLQIQNKSYCLDFLEKQKEKQESLAQNLSKRNELEAKRENLSFLHPIKKSELSNEITVFEKSMKMDAGDYNALEQKIIENEKEEEVLTGEYEVMETKAIAGKDIGIFKIAVTIMCICLICGIIAIVF